MQLALADSNINNAVLAPKKGAFNLVQKQIDALGIKSATDLNTKGTKVKLTKILAEHNSANPKNQLELQNIHWHDTKAELCEETHQAQKNLHTADCKDCDHLSSVEKKPDNPNIFSKIKDFFLSA